MAQLDKAPDYESGDWGFKSLLGYFFVVFVRFGGTVRGVVPRGRGVTCGVRDWLAVFGFCAEAKR